MTDYLAVIHYLHILLIKRPIVWEQNEQACIVAETNLPFPSG